MKLTDIKEADNLCRRIDGCEDIIRSLATLGVDDAITLTIRRGEQIGCATGLDRDQLVDLLTLQAQENINAARSRLADLGVEFDNEDADVG